MTTFVMRREDIFVNLLLTQICGGNWLVIGRSHYLLELFVLKIRSRDMKKNKSVNIKKIEKMQTLIVQ